MPFLIDGHNLLWAVRGMPGEVDVITEIKLCHMLSKYLRRSDEMGEIFFDGTGPSDKAVFEGIRNLEVFFAGAASDADTVIEERIKASTAPKNLVVVSSDNRIRKAARARKATAQKAEFFWVDVLKLLETKEREVEPVEKQQGLTESETEFWLKLFGLDR